MSENTLQNIVARKIESLEALIRTCEKKIAADFMNAFEWGYHAKIYEAEFEIKYYRYLEKVINENDDTSFFEMYLKDNIDYIERELLRGGYTLNSTNEYSNLAHAIRKESSCEIRQEYLELLSLIKNKKPIKIK